MLRDGFVWGLSARVLPPLLFLLALSPCVTHADPGDLDPSFGIGGIVTTDGGVASAVAIQADGKIVAAGLFDSGDIGLVRYNIDGSLDTSFGTGGRVATGISNISGEPVLVIQPDGKAVVAASIPSPISARDDFALARYNVDGSPDQGFGIGGKVITNFAFDGHGLDSDESAHAIARQADGKLVAAGFTRFINQDPKFAVARYNADGSLDQTFGPGGTVITTVKSNNQGRAVVIQPDGKIVVGGLAFTGLSGGFSLVRYNPDGSLDTNFGTAGAVVTPNGGELLALVLQRDNKLVAAGDVFPVAGGSDIALVRYNADGSLDQNFGADGAVITHFSSPFGGQVFARARALALQTDGKLVAAGAVPSQFSPIRSDFAVVRYNADGSLDQRFGASGIVVTDFGFWTEAWALGVQADGKLVAAGAGLSSRHKFALARYVGRLNEAPVADAGPDQTANEGALVQLDGTGSRDPNGDVLTYEWTQVAGPLASLDLTDPARPTFTAPSVSIGGATLTFKLTVSDRTLTSAPDEVNLNVKNVNHAPVAQAGPDQTVNEGSRITLDGGASFDVDGDPLVFSWGQTAGPAVVLSDPTAIAPTFTAPRVGPWGVILRFELTVSDGIDRATDMIDVLVESVNHDPTANAGPDQTTNEGTLVKLDGIASSDPDGDSLTYTWAQLGGSPVALSDVHSPFPSFTAPLVGPGGDTLVFRLEVSDGLGGRATDDVTIVVQNVNDPPVCDAAQPSQRLLWPPNHRLVRVGIVGVTDRNNDRVKITVTRVTQDEPVNGVGDGDTSPDAVIDGGTVLLRAERSGTGNGRIYHLQFSADDGGGGTCTGSVVVGVPHDMKPGHDPIDDGQSFDSTVP